MAFLFVWQILISGPLEVGSGLVAAAQFSTAFVRTSRRSTTGTHAGWTSSRSIRTSPTDRIAVGVAFGPTAAVRLRARRGDPLPALPPRHHARQAERRLPRRRARGARLGAGRGGHPLRPVPGVRHRRSPTTSGRPTSASPSGPGWRSRSTPTSATTTSATSGPRSATRPAPSRGRSSSVRLIVVVLFALVHLAIVGVVPWREAAKETDNLTAEFMGRCTGRGPGTSSPSCSIGSCFASCFSGMLGYSRVPYAAAKEGHFFRWFAAVHPRLHIPHRALLLIGGDGPVLELLQPGRRSSRP